MVFPACAPVTNCYVFSGILANARGPTRQGDREHETCQSDICCIGAGPYDYAERMHRSSGRSRLLLRVARLSRAVRELRRKEWRLRVWRLWVSLIMKKLTAIAACIAAFAASGADAQSYQYGEPDQYGPPDQYAQSYQYGPPVQYAQPVCGYPAHWVWRGFWNCEYAQPIYYPRPYYYPNYGYSLGYYGGGYRFGGGYRGGGVQHRDGGRGHFAGGHGSHR